METCLPTLAQLSDDALLARVTQLVHGERESTAALVAHLAELDGRRLYLGEGCSSLFGYCTQVLHLSEHAAYGRIEAARASRRFPVILEMLASGSVHLTTVGLLASHLTPENHRELLDAAVHQSKRQVEELVAGLRPLPAIAPSIRKLPGGKDPVAFPGPSEPATGAGVRETATMDAVPTPRPADRGVVAVLAPELYKVQFTASAEIHEKLRRAQDLLRHQIPNGDLAAVFDRALSVLLEQLLKSKVGATDRPGSSRGIAPGSRHIPAAVRRAAWARDRGRCAFVSSTGRRCGERGRLEFHHVWPHGDGGVPTIDNIELRCRAHNKYESDQYFGPHQAPEARGESAWLEPVQETLEQQSNQEEAAWAETTSRSIARQPAPEQLASPGVQTAAEDSIASPGGQADQVGSIARESPERGEIVPGLTVRESNALYFVGRACRSDPETGRWDADQDRSAWGSSPAGRRCPWRLGPDRVGELRGLSV
jgi:hypothetical protein